MTEQLKAISIDLQAVASLRNEVHELRVSFETLTERVDALLKATGEDTEDRSEPERAHDRSERPFEPEIPESEAA